MPYVKLDTGILDSTLWLSDANVRVVFITMLAMAKPDGVCEATAPGIARRANLSIESVRSALRELEAPDEDSRSLDQEGRRIVRVDGGYFIVNYEKYRQKDHTAAERKRKERAQRKAKEAQNVTDVTRDVTVVTPDVTQAEAEAKAKAERSTYPECFARAWSSYPRRQGSNPKKGAYRAWCARVKEGYREADLEAGVRGYAEHVRSEDIEGTRYVMQAKTFFGPDCHFEQSWESESEPEEHWE
jgi:hypothetical protein